MRALCCVCMLWLLGACSTGVTGSSISAEQEAAKLWPATVGDVKLHVARATQQTEFLDLGLIVFDPGIPDDKSTHSELGIFPKIREVEANYLPVALREVLVSSNNWGVVRVLPEDDPTLELRITGEIIHSDGIDLVLHIKAIDGSGVLWLDRNYRDHSSRNDYPVSLDGDPFGDMFRQIANDLGALKTQYSVTEMANIRRVAQLRYAASLSPEAFADFLAVGADGTFSLQRLPAEDDPMMARVDRIRNQEYLFIDTVDEQYIDLYEDMKPTYDLWRQYDREQAIFNQDYQERAVTKEKYGQRGSFIAMEQTYNTFRKSKELDQGVKETAAGFNSEVAPTVMEVSGRVFRLSGSLDTQYAEWRTILRSIFALETDVPALEK